MLTLNAANFLKDNTVTNNEDSLRIELADFSQIDEISGLLKAQGYLEIIPEDDDGVMFLTASKKKTKPEAVAAPEPKPVVSAQSVIRNSTGLIISCESGKYARPFFKKALQSLLLSRTKPKVLALMNGAVSLAAYNSQTCQDIKKLEEAGVKVLISESCADVIGVSEAVGVGKKVDMSEIFEALFECEKVVSI